MFSNPKSCVLFDCKTQMRMQMCSSWLPVNQNNVSEGFHINFYNRIWDCGSHMLAPKMFVAF